MKRVVRTCRAALGAALLWSAEARADDQADETRARELFDNANRLLDDKSFEQALQLLRESRELRPGAGNTRNMAHCLGELDRWDEALEMYEELLGRFGAQVLPADQESIKGFMTAYRKRVGQLDISANVNGQIVIDGRHRGILPLRGPLYVLPGRHLVRIVKEGYATHEESVDITVRQTSALDAKLTPLTTVGRLRVEVDPQAELPKGGSVWIDGSPVGGTLPWEGSLRPGPHVVFASSGDSGSALVRVVVVQSQTVTTKLAARKLGAPVRLRVDPPTASVSIDGIDLGHGGYEGRLPVGDHDVSVREEGYVTAEFKLNSTTGISRERLVALAVAPKHPRWSSGWHLHLEGVVAPLFADSLGSGAEMRAAGPPAYGGMLALRVGFELPVRFGVDLSFGGLELNRTVMRSFDHEFMASQQPVPVRYDVRDELRARGPFLAFGARQRLPIGGDRFDLRVGLGFAVALLSARDVSSTTARSGSKSSPAETEDNGVPAETVTLFLTPEVVAGYRLGPVELGVGLGVVAVLLDGGALSTGETRVHGCPRSTPADVRCAPGVKLLEEERSFGRFTAWAPRLSAKWTFF